MPYKATEQPKDTSKETVAPATKAGGPGSVAEPSAAEAAAEAEASREDAPASERGSSTRRPRESVADGAGQNAGGDRKIFPSQYGCEVWPD